MSHYEVGAAPDQTTIKWPHESLAHLAVGSAQRYSDTGSPGGFATIAHSHAGEIRLPPLPSYNSFSAGNNAAGGMFRPSGFAQPQPQPGLITPPQQSHHDTQKLLAQFNTSGTTPQQLSQFVTPQQIYMAAAAEEAKLLDSRKLIQDWQNSSKLAQHINTGTSDQLWLEQKPNLSHWMQQQQHHHQQQQHQQILQQSLAAASQQLSAPSSRPPSTIGQHSSSIVPPHPSSPHFLSTAHHQQQQVAALQQAVQRQQQRVAAAAALLSPTQHEAATRSPSIPLEHVLLKNQTVPSLATHLSTSEMASPAPQELRGNTALVAAQQQKQQQSQQHVEQQQPSPLPIQAPDLQNRMGSLASNKFSPANQINTTINPPTQSSPKAVQDVKTMASADGTQQDSEYEISGSHSVGSNIKTNDQGVEMEDNDHQEQNLSSSTHEKSRANQTVTSSSEATEAGGLCGTEEKKLDAEMTQPRMRSILDYENSDIDDASVQDEVQKDSEDDKPVQSSTGLNDENLHESLDNDTKDDTNSPSSLLLNFSQQQHSIVHSPSPPPPPPPSEETCRDTSSRENPSNTKQDRGVVTALRIEERILSEKLGLPTSATPAPPNSSTNSTSSVFSSSNSPPRSTPLSQPPSSSSPVSESFSTTPTGSFCRAPGLGPVVLPEGHSSTQFPLVCPICGFSCNSKFHYNSHMNTHGDHQCTMCDYTSRTEGRLKKHMRDSHTAEEQMAAGLDLEPSICASATATPIASTTLSTPAGINLATTMASVLEAANLAAAAQAAAANISNDAAPASSTCSGAPDNQDSPSAVPPSTSVPTTSSTNGLLPSALDQIRAFTENPSILPDLSSTNLATALMSHGLLGNAPLLSEPSTSFPIEEPSTSSGNAERRGSGGKPKTYKCKQCNHVSTSKEEQWAHARTHIPVEKQLGCTRCGFVTEYKHHLEYHLRNHMGSKPFHCKKCAYACVNKSMLNSHMKSHTNVYQFRCRDCTYATKYCHSLKLHLKKYNHNRAGDANEATVVNGQNGSPFESLSDGDTLRRLSESYSMNGGEGNSPSPQTSIPHSLANSISLNPIVTPNSLSLASQLLLRQHQLEQMDAVMRMNTLSGMMPGAMLTPRCALCNYQALNQEDNIRHQMSHLLSTQNDTSFASLYSSIGIQNPLRPPSQTAVEEGEEKRILKNECEERSGSEEPDQMAVANVDQDERGLSNISDDSHASPVESAKSSGDEGSLTADETSDKGARKRKAGLKLNQIAARLQEKNSPDMEDVNMVDTNDSATNQRMEVHEKESAGESPIAVSLPISVPVASRPNPTPVLPHLSLTSDVGNLNIFQQACIAHMHNMEQKLRSAFELWRFSCPHCKMAFQDEPLFHIHMGYHGYDNPFKCNRCGQACNDGLSFNLHLLQAKH